MKKLLVCSIFLYSAVIISAVAQENILEQVKEKYNAASTISADITQASGSSNLTGKIYLKVQNKMRIEFKNTTIISDGSTIWNYNKKENKVIINTFNENDPSAWSLYKIMNEYPEKSDVSVDKVNGEDVLVLNPKPDSGLNFNSVRLWINEDNLVKKLKIEQGGSTTEVSVSNYMLNRDIPDSRFSFTPPEGTKVIDLR